MCLSPLPAEGDSPIFADFAAKIGTVPVNGYDYLTMLAGCHWLCQCFSSREHWQSQWHSYRALPFYDVFVPACVLSRTSLRSTL